MTAVMEARPTSREKRLEAFATMAREQRLFDATRPPCPRGWCEGECDTIAHFGNAVMHVSAMVEVPVTPDRHGDPAAIGVRVIRHDSLAEGSTSVVELDLTNTGSLTEDRAELTAEQALLLVAQLQCHIDLIQPERDVPAEDVRVGDWLPVGSEWLYVYGVDVDEPSGSVQISTTVDRDEYPEIDGNQDEEPHTFAPGDMVRVRRGGAK